MKTVTALLIGIIRVYQWTISAVTGPTCRFEPTCSAYAVEAMRRHGPLRGTWLAVRRVGRCHPWHAGGYDPVPAPTAGHDGIGRSGRPSA